MLLALTKIVKSYIHKGGQAKKDAQVFFCNFIFATRGKPLGSSGYPIRNSARLVCREVTRVAQSQELEWVENPPLEARPKCGLYTPSELPPHAGLRAKD